MSYTIRQDGWGEYVEKKSVFTGCLRRCTSEAQARDYIDGIRRENRNARHHVFAYIIGEGQPLIRYSDDGEPQGTGGQPVLHVLEQQGLSDVCLVVSRVFGGVLLGAPGLTRAYGKAAAEAVASTDHWQVVDGIACTLVLTYEDHARIRPFLETLQILETDFAADITLTAVVRSGEETALAETLRDLTRGGGLLFVGEAGRYFLRRDGHLEPVEPDE